MMPGAGPRNPDVAPLELSVPAKQAYDHALAMVNKRRWLVLRRGRHSISSSR